jgi:dihydrofolate reductase
MRKLIVNEFLTIDGVAQAPGGAEEDQDGGFAHGGWHMPPAQDERAQNWVIKSIREMGALVLGRRTYEIFAAYWPNASEEQAVIADPLNTVPKHVASTTLKEPLAWQNSRLLGGDVPAAVGALKEQDGGEIHVIGSTRLVQTLLAEDLVDELRLTIDPLMVGGGKRIFPEDGALRRFRLAAHEVTEGGSMLCAYARAE